MSEETRFRFITPTYQSNLNAAIHTVVNRLSAGQVVGTWMALETLYLILPPNVSEEVDGDYERIKSEMAHALRISKNHDPLYEDAGQKEALNRVLRKHNRRFLRKLIEGLHRHGYLERPNFRVGKDVFESLEEEEP